MSRLISARLISYVAATALVVSLIPYTADRAVADELPEDGVGDVTTLPALPGSPESPNVSTIPEGTPAEPEPLPEPAMTTIPLPDGEPEIVVDPSLLADELEVVARSETTTTYELPEGGLVKRISIDPLNVRGDDGWTEVSTELNRTDDGWVVDDHPLDPVFADEANARDSVTVTRSGHEVSFGLLGAGGGDPELVETGEDGQDQLAYRDVAAGTDVEYTIEPGTIKEEIVLNERPQRWKTSWTWQVDPGDLTPRMAEAYTVEFVDARGEVVLIIPSPIAEDSSGEEGKRSPATAALTASIGKDAAGVWRYSVNAKSAWLQDESRVYPVRIDPSVAIAPNQGGYGYKSDGSTSTGTMHVGNTRENNTNRYWRSIMGINYGSIPGKFIAAAQVGINYDGYGTTTTRNGQVRHANCFGYNCTGDWITDYTLGTSFTQTSDWNVAQRLADRLRIGDYPAWMILGDESAGIYTHKRILGDVWIEYWNYPTVTAVQPFQNQTGVSLRPELKVQTTNDPGGNQWFGYKVSTTPDMNNIVTQAFWLPTSQWIVPEGVLRPGTEYYWSGGEVDEYNGHLGQTTEKWTAPVRFVTNQVPLTAEATSTPGTAMGVPQTVTTLTPELTTVGVTDTDNVNDGQPMRYRFKIATGADGKSGAVVTSNWLNAGSDNVARWTVPQGTLQDGGVYSWLVQTNDGRDINVENTWRKAIKVDLRLGSSGPSPFDSAGPVTVNLANGNANLSFASPTVQTLGGPMGMSFTYNSQEVRSANRGLFGEYFDARVNGVAPSDPSGFTFDNKTAVLARTDPSVSFDWGLSSPADAVPADYFLARWTGFVTLPQQYANQQVQFGVRQDDGARLWINGTQAVNSWQNTAPILTYGPATNYGGSALPLRFEYYELNVTAVAELWIKVGSTEFIIPPDWFTKTVNVLPAGWRASTPIAGSSSAWVNAQINENAIVLTDVTGKTHTFQKTSTGGYTPPAGEYDVVSLDAAGLVVLTDEDGTVYQFSKEGKVVSSTAAVDGQKPAAPIQILNGNGVTTEIVDPVSKDGATYTRKVSFTYQNSGQTACPQLSGSGYAAAPVDMLCVISYPDGTVTNLYYNDGGKGQLAAILDPGNELTTFGYTQDANALLNIIVDSTANDVLAFSGVAATDAHRTTITYQNDLKVGSVALPAPDGATLASRPVKTFDYGAGTGTTYVDIAGLTGHANTVTYDTAWRQLTATSAMGVTASQQWHPLKDLSLSYTDHLGRKSTSVYDTATDRVVESNGPAPGACFDASGKVVANPLTTQGCGFVPSRVVTAYDGGMNGLQATFYANRSLSGKPALFAAGIGGPNGAVDRNWDVASPGAGIPINNWSLRMTGLITFPETGAYTLRTTRDDGARVWVNDVLMIDRWLSQPATDATGVSFQVQAGETRRIRIEYFDDDVTALLQLKWSTPSNGSFVVVPGAQLRPDYGLVTQSKIDDSTVTAGTAAPAVTTSFTYQHPWLGVATQSTVDPSGLSLQTATSYEQPGASGWLRRISKSMPAAATSGAPATAASVSAYYGDLETAPAVCNIPAGTRQYGFVKSRTGATPASGSPVVTTYVYDLMGRIVGAKTTGDTAWSCFTFDARGRQTKNVAVGPTGTPTLTTTSNYTATAVGLKTSVSDGAVPSSPNGSFVVSYTDFLGRITSYTDVWNTVTKPTYEALTGRVTSTTTKPDGLPAQTTSYEYDLDGKLKKVSMLGQVVATVTYDAQQQLASIAYQGGATLGSLVRDAAGRQTSQTWVFPSSSSIVDTVVRSQSGNVVQETLTRGSTTYVSKYSYDAAGRLIGATIPGHQLTYQFASTGGCGQNTAAGASGNRTGLVDVFTAPNAAPVTTTTAYCYDWADRLTSSVVTNPVTGANTVADGLAATDLVYDAAGRTTRLADMQFTYDSRGHHVGTTYDDGSTVVIRRDATGRVVTRTIDPAGATPASTVTYLYSGDSDVPWAQRDGTSTPVRTNELPGGVTITGSTLTAATWSYASLLGHTLATGTGSSTGALVLVDPFGQPLDPTTLSIGSSVSDDGGTIRGNTGWHQAAMKVGESAGTTAIIEMGERLYVPALGRFLQVDPIEGGVDNDYVWPTDPINEQDTDGQFAAALAAPLVLAGPVGWILLGAVAVAGAVWLVTRPEFGPTVRDIWENRGKNQPKTPKPNNGKPTQKKPQGEEENAARTGRGGKPIKTSGHTSGARSSTRDTHQKGAARLQQKLTDNKRKNPRWKQR